MKNNFVYVVNDNLYVNLTNRCSNRCEFCVRYYDQPIYGDLWLEKEPTAQEIINILEKQYDISKYNEVVFCGYGEPTYKWEDIKIISEYVHSKGKKTRVNTNGQGNILNNRDITSEFAEYIDKVNISLNATDKEKYDAICHSQFGIEAFDIMLNFARSCASKNIPTFLSVVDCIGEEEINKARLIAEQVGCQLKVRELL